MTTRTLFFVFAFLLVVSLANAGDERSIKDLAKALAGLSSDVDPAEAQALSYTAHTTARRLKKEYRVALNPEFTVFLFEPAGSRMRSVRNCLRFSWINIRRKSCQSFGQICD